MGSWMLAVSYPKNNSGNGNDDDITVIPPTDGGGGNDDIIGDPPIYEESIIILDDNWNLNSLTIKSKAIDSDGFVNENDIFFTGFSKDGNVRYSQFTPNDNDSKGYFKNGCYDKGTTPSDDMYMKWPYGNAGVELINFGDDGRGYVLECFITGSESQGEASDGQGETIYLPVQSKTVDGKEVLYIPKSGNWEPTEYIGEIIETTYTLE